MENARRTRKNLEKEQFCRAEANNDDVRDPPQTELQEEWQVEEDLLLRIREFSNCFSSFLPAELAWNPIEADGYTFVNYLCVSGPFKGRGYARLFDDCIRKSRKQGRKGVCILSSAKKKPFLADPKYLKRLGFSVCDESDCGIQFWYLPFEPNAEQPRFRDCAKRPHADAGGLVLYYTSKAHTAPKT